RVLMRSVRSATWTSGEPVSPALVAYSLTSADLRSWVMVIRSSPNGLQVEQTLRRERALLDGADPQGSSTPHDEDRILCDGSASASEQNLLALSQALGFRVLHGQCRDAVQHGLEGAEKPLRGVAAGRLMAQFRELFQRNHVLFGKRSHRDTPEPRHM